MSARASWRSTGPEDRSGGGKAQRTERHDRGRHDDHGPRRGDRVGGRPLPPDGQLGPHGEREHDEDREGRRPRRRGCAARPSAWSRG